MQYRSGTFIGITAAEELRYQSESDINARQAFPFYQAANPDRYPVVLQQHEVNTKTIFRITFQRYILQVFPGFRFAVYVPVADILQPFLCIEQL